ncbi:DUF1338 domain-containing protein [Microseira wollei]|uniref:2-oxoadipate dioxygenase/decarboxylase n=1 Tax=Microseira wollei NIES-4236 TaxID=2530354 RepID=A0AAV3XLY8_9CYAN|nr:DUF1338 domain-containing protein [Microseira wollei]GET40542.1 hypothetical protein MiSe_53520 [Microseira wollei NIES-4236]
MTNYQIAQKLWHKLWENYISRVNYAQVYQKMITAAGGTVANDHIAFRSLRLTVEQKNLGIEHLAQIVAALGYAPAGEYHFPSSHLYARHYRHPKQDEFDLPKLFISELIVDELPDEIAKLISQTVVSGLSIHSPTFPSNIESLSESEIEQFVNQLSTIFTRPWQPPRKSTVETVNNVTQYGAWVLLHGYAVNHFTGYINRQNTPEYPEIESTASGLSQRGVPMKAQIEGSPCSGLRQTATHAVQEMVTVLDDTSGELINIPWTYAYYEIAERNLIEIDGGEKVLFEGFLDAQAKNLFEMTRK